MRSTNWARPIRGFASSSPIFRRPARSPNFAANFRDRFINTGVSEQIMIGMTAGMAQRGLEAVRLYDRDFHALSAVRDGARRSLLSESSGHHRRHRRRRDLFDARRHAPRPGRRRHRQRHPQPVGHRAVRSGRSRGGDALVRGAGAGSGLSAAGQGRRAGFVQSGAGSLGVRQAAPAARGPRRLHSLLRSDHEARLCAGRAIRGGRQERGDRFGAYAQAARPRRAGRDSAGLSPMSSSSRNARRTAASPCA